MIYLPNLQSAPPLTVPAGYYTLREVSTLASKAGFPLKASPDCADEVYAVSFRGAPKTLIAVLGATRRLAVVPSKREWLVMRSVSDAVNDKSSVQSWCYRTIGLSGRIYARAAMIANNRYRAEHEFEQKPLPPTEALFEQAAEGVADLWKNELAYSQIAVPARLASGSTMPTVNLAVPLGLGSNRSLLGPDGDLRESGLRGLDDPKLEDRDLAALAVSSTLSAKLVFDPVRDAAVFRETTLMAKSLESAWQMSDYVLRYPHNAPLGPNDALWPTEAASYVKRKAATDALLSGEGATKSVNMPRRSLRLSETLLKISEGTGKNLIAYVSPLSDRSLPFTASRSLRSAITDSNANRWDKEREALSLHERIYAKMRPPEPSESLLGNTVTEVGETYVVVNETDFLDLLASGPTMLPTPIENRALRGSPPTLSEIVGNVASLDLGKWRSSSFSEHYLRFCNPLSLLPVARLLAASPESLAKFGSLGVGRSLSLKYEDLAPAERAALDKGLKEAGPYCDAAKPFKMEPMTTTLFLATLGLDGAVLDVRRYADRFEIDVSKGGFVWSSWITGVRSGAVK